MNTDTISQKIKTQLLPSHIRPLFKSDFITKDQLNTLVLLKLLTKNEAWYIEFDLPF